MASNSHLSMISNGSKEDLRVFVYGTLKPGESNYARYCAGHVIDQFPAIAYGALLDLPLGYPAMVEGHQPVHGVVLNLDSPDILAILDALEDYEQNRPPKENEYIRTRIRVFDPQGTSRGTAWTYIMDKDRAIELGGKILDQGEWNS